MPLWRFLCPKCPWREREKGAPAGRRRRPRRAVVAAAANGDDGGRRRMRRGERRTARRAAVAGQRRGRRSEAPPPSHLPLPCSLPPVVPAGRCRHHLARPLAPPGRPSPSPLLPRRLLLPLPSPIRRTLRLLNRHRRHRRAARARPRDVAAAPIS
uniref:Uncharacterized protein n=1 Tax=Oryza glumipatula TaxID=40148 RepID=A0A0D9YU34_9ORYZ